MQPTAQVRIEHPQGQPLRALRYPGMDQVEQFPGKPRCGFRLLAEWHHMCGVVAGR